MLNHFTFLDLPGSTHLWLCNSSYCLFISIYIESLTLQRLFNELESMSWAKYSSYSHRACVSGGKTKNDPGHNRGMNHYHEVINTIGKGHLESHSSKPCYLSPIPGLYNWMRNVPCKRSYLNAWSQLAVLFREVLRNCWRKKRLHWGQALRVYGLLSPLHVWNETFMLPALLACLHISLPSVDSPSRTRSPNILFHRCLKSWSFTTASGRQLRYCPSLSGVPQARSSLHPSYPLPSLSGSPPFFLSHTQGWI